MIGGRMPTGGAVPNPGDLRIPLVQTSGSATI